MCQQITSSLRAVATVAICHPLRAFTRSKRMKESSV
jgi:hypothetical protein